MLDYTRLSSWRTATPVDTARALLHARRDACATTSADLDEQAATRLANRQRCASPRPRRSATLIGHPAALPGRECGRRRCACCRPDPRDLQAHLALARVGEQPPLSTRPRSRSGGAAAVSARSFRVDSETSPDRPLRDCGDLASACLHRWALEKCWSWLPLAAATSALRMLRRRRT